MNTEMEENNCIQTKFFRSRSNNRWMCNELVHELCKEIPIVKTSDSILLTAHNMYTYLEPRFHKKYHQLIYRDAIAFLKAMMNAKEKVRISIGGVKQNKERGGSIVVINKERSDDEFKLETNHFCLHIQNGIGFRNNWVPASDNDAQFEYANLLYFLRLIAPMHQPIHLEILWSDERIGRFKGFLNALTCCIDSIGLTPKQFNFTSIDEALAKCNKLRIFNSVYPEDVPKLIHWLTNGQSKKYLFVWECRIFGLNIAPLIQMLEELKKEFPRSISKRRFVAHLELYEPLDEFTFGNELTGERLQLRRIGANGRWIIHVLSRLPKTTNSTALSTIARKNLTPVRRRSFR